MLQRCVLSLEDGNSQVRGSGGFNSHLGSNLTLNNGSHDSGEVLFTMIKQTKVATEATKVDNSLSVKTVGINSKQSAPFLVPELNEGQKLAVVDEGVLKYLTDLLPTASFEEIKHEFIEKIRDTYTLKKMLVAIRETLVFHETCNVLERYFDPKTTVTLEAPFNVPKPEPTLLERAITWCSERDELARLTGELGYDSIQDYAEHTTKPDVQPVEVAIPRTKDDDLYGGK